MENNIGISVDFIKQLKQEILKSRYIVAKIANAESLKLYYSVGKALENQFRNEKWGAKVLENISSQLQQEIPGLRGFSASNLKKMRVFYNEWSDTDIISSSVTTKLENAQNTISSSVTTKFIDTNTKIKKLCIYFIYTSL